MMCIGIAADHGGFELKVETTASLKAAGYEVAGFGAHDLATLLDTDQTRCFDEAGRALPCVGSGQDAEFKADHRIPAERFHAMTDVVLDSLTKLTWCRNANPAEFPLDWQAAHDFISEMNGVRAFGRSDWRLPSRRELFTLISHEVFNPALPKDHLFENVFHGYYWTCTPCHRLPDPAWYIHLGGGRIYRGMKHGSYMVWPVISLGGELPSVEDPLSWDVDRKGILDRRTGLTWGHLADAARRSVTWQEALDGVKAMNRKTAGRYTDWRLPIIFIKSILKEFGASPNSVVFEEKIDCLQKEKMTLREIKEIN